MQTSILWRSIVLGSCLIGLTACGGGGDDGGAANPPSNPGDPIVDPGDGLGANSTIPATAQRPAYSVNVLEDAQGDSALTINSSLGDAAYLIFKGNKPGVGQLVGGLYQAPDGQVARLTFKQDGSGRLEKLETDAATIRYTDYSSNSVTVTVEYPDGSLQRFPNQPIDPALQQRLAVQALDIDRNDVGFVIGLVGTGLSVAFCVTPAITGVGTLVTIGCANALVATVGTVLGDAQLGAGSSVVDLISGWAGDKGALATGIMGAISGVLGWSTDRTELEVMLSGRIWDARNKHRLLADGKAADVRVIVTPRAGTGGVQTLTPDSMGNFSVPRHLGNGSYRLAVEAEGHLTEYFTLAVTDDRVAVSKDSELPNASSEVIYDVRHQDPRIPAIVYMPIDMYPAPHIKGRIIWPRRDEDGGEFVDIVEGGMVTLMTTKGEKAAFHTVSMVEQGGTAPGGEAGAGGYYDIWLPSRHGTFKLRYTGTHTKMEDIVIAPDQASTIAIEIPKTAHLPESSEIRTFAPGDLPVDIPVQTRYDGSWFITAVPSIPSYTYTYEYEVDGETVTGQETEICESFTVNLTLEGGSGIAYTSEGDESGVSIDIDGKFSGEVWGLSWSGYIWQGGSYAWDGAGDMDVGCYGTYTSQQR